MGVTSYRDLNVWQLGMEIAEQVYVLTRTFPKFEVYGLSSQLQRAAVSIPSNIAEGHARDSTREYLRHISIALGSLAELETQLILAQSLGYCTQKHTSDILVKCTQQGKMLHSLQRSLRARTTRSM